LSSSAGLVVRPLQVAVYQTARALEVTVIALTGQSGGKLLGLADIAIRVPARETPRVQEMHVLVYHALCAMLERDLITTA